MRTSMKYEVVKDCYGYVDYRGAVLTITLGKKDSMDDAYRFLSLLEAKTGLEFGGEWADNCYTASIEMDRDDFAVTMDEYKLAKESYKNGEVLVVESNNEVSEEITEVELTQEEIKEITTGSIDFVQNIKDEYSKSNNLNKAMKQLVYYMLHVDFGTRLYIHIDSGIKIRYEDYKKLNKCILNKNHVNTIIKQILLN